MPFSGGNDRVHVPQGELRIVSVHDDGVLIELQPSHGPIGGISIFINAESFPILLCGIADSMSRLHESGDGSSPSQNPASGGNGDKRQAAVVQTDHVSADNAAEIWLRTEHPKPERQKSKDVLDAPSLWGRRWGKT